jgi:hypothetical protein
VRSYFNKGTLFTRDSERCGNGRLSPYGPCQGNVEGGGFFTGDVERW